jgi:hypothetical protein
MAFGAGEHQGVRLEADVLGKMVLEDREDEDAAGVLVALLAARALLLNAFDQAALADTLAGIIRAAEHVDAVLDDIGRQLPTWPEWSTTAGPSSTFRTPWRRPHEARNTRPRKVKRHAWPCGTPSVPPMRNWRGCISTSPPATWPS